MKRHPLVRHHRRIVWSFLIVAICLATVAVTLLIREAMREDDLPPTQPPDITASPTATNAPTATPGVVATPTIQATATVPEGSLSDLMQYAPDRLADGSLPLPEVATYADIAAWKLWQPDPAAPLTEGQLGDLALPPIIANRALDPIWKATYGFSLADIDQFLAIGQPPDYTFIMRGDFDEDELKRAWVGSSYQAVEYRGFTIWSTFPGDTIDMSNPSSRPAMASLNNIVLLDDHTMVAAAKLSRVQDAIRLQQGEGKSLAGNDAIAQVIGLETPRQRFVTAVIAKGELVESAPLDERRSGAGTVSPLTRHGTSVATPVPSPVPMVRMCLFGMMMQMETTVPATPVAVQLPATPPEFTIALVFDDDDANSGILAIRQRFGEERSATTGQPWTDSYDLYGGIRNDDGLVVLHLLAKSGTIDWMQMVNDRDFGFLAWQPADGDG